MAKEKNPAPQTEEQLLEQPAEEAQPEMSAKEKAQQAEIEKLRKQLAEAQKARPGAQNDAEVVRKACAEAAAAGIDPWTVTIRIRSPRRPGKEDPFYWLNVNGQSVQVPADDKYYELKLPWAETLINSLEAERHAAEFQDAMEVYDPITNPHRD